jgi:uncharacterized protein YbjQ (UPF0145 family)
MAVMSGLSGNEMYCLHLKGLKPGDVVIGNSVYSMGVIGGFAAGMQNLFGGEVTNMTQLIHDGRETSYERMVKEAEERGGVGITGVSSQLGSFQGNVEFLSVASCVHREDGQAERLQFTTSADGQELYCQIDAGYTPRKFVFGNIAYSIGLGGGLLGGLKSMARGEISEFSNTFNHTRHFALNRMVNQAKQVGANSVVGVQTLIMPFQACHEMIMMGTASFNPDLPPECTEDPVTSDLTCEEMWNVTRMGYMPLKLVMGTAVYSLGVVGGFMAKIKGLGRGEISELSSLIYDAREHALDLVRKEAEALGADDVLGIRTHIHELGSLIEFMAIGTAVKKHPGLKTKTDTLPPQAIIRDKDTWVSNDDNLFGGASGGGGDAS